MRKGTEVAIVGGGIAGLSAAHALHERGRRFVLFEASPRLGGVIRTERAEGFLIEGGPDSLFVQKPDGLALVRALGLEGRLVPTNPTKRTVYVLHDRRLHPLPEGMMLTVPTRILPVLRSPLFSWPAKARMGLDLVLPRRREGGDESIASFVRRRFGHEVLERVAEPLLAGIHAGDPETLSLRATFPRLADLEERYGSLVRGLRAAPKAPPSASPFVSLQDGLGELAEALVSRLPKEALRPGRAVKALGRTDGAFTLALEGGWTSEASSVILALPAHAAAPLAASLSPEASASLSEIRFASTVVLVLGYRREDVAHPLDGYGVIVPRAAGLRTSALSFHSTKFPGRAPEDRVMLRVFLGGIQDGGVVDLEDAELLAVAEREVAPVLGLRGKPVLVRVFRWPRATPQMEVGHFQKVARIERALEAVPGLFLTGAGLRGTGVPDCIADAQRTAASVDGFLDLRAA
jgi:oxygen-dependent protoporphyrinogen oxidase